MPFKKTGDVSSEYTEIPNNRVKDEKRQVESDSGSNLRLAPPKDDKKDSPKWPKRLK